jgi:hypothetical protein
MKSNKTHIIGDISYRIEYLRLLFESLRKCRNGESPQELTFTPEEALYIEYYCKDVAQRHISQNSSRTQCVELFKERVHKLTQKDKEEWERLSEIMNCHSKLFTAEDHKNIADMRWYFLRKSSSKEKFEVSLG